jgi:hypothetical protein
MARSHLLSLAAGRPSAPCRPNCASLSPSRRASGWVASVAVPRGLSPRAAFGSCPRPRPRSFPRCGRLSGVFDLPSPPCPLSPRQRLWGERGTRPGPGATRTSPGGDGRPGTGRAGERTGGEEGKRSSQPSHSKNWGEEGHAAATALQPRTETPGLGQTHDGHGPQTRREAGRITPPAHPKRGAVTAGSGDATGGKRPRSPAVTTSGAG